MDVPEDLSLKRKAENGRKSSSRPENLPSGLNLLVAALDVTRVKTDENSVDSSHSETSSLSPTPSSSVQTSSMNARFRSGRPQASDYWEKRRRNNDAAKKSREKRRLNDSLVEKKMEDLTTENNILKKELHSTRSLPAFNTYHASLPHQQNAFSSASKITTLIPPVVSGAQLIHPALLAPQHPILQQLYQAQIRAVLATQTAGPFFPAGHCSAFQPVQQARQPANSPDSSTVLNEGENGLATSLEMPVGKQYLRYKLLEKQQQQQQQHGGEKRQQSNRNTLLSSLLSTRRPSPSIPQNRTESESGLATSSSSPSCQTVDLKNCLSNLAVHLTGKSESSSHSGETSLASPDSSRGSNSQTSPIQGENTAILKALRGDTTRVDLNNDDTSNERYVERRRRNNEAAKRCRANRRALFEFRFKRAQLLESENEQLRDETRRLSRELFELKRLVTGKIESDSFEEGHSTSPSNDSARFDSYSDGDDGDKLLIVDADSQNGLG